MVAASAICLLDEESIGEASGLGKIEVVESVSVNVSDGDALPASDVDVVLDFDEVEPLIHAGGELSVEVRGVSEDGFGAVGEHGGAVCGACSDDFEVVPDGEFSEGHDAVDDNPLAVPGGVHLEGAALAFPPSLDVGGGFYEALLSVYAEDFDLGANVGGFFDEVGEGLELFFESGEPGEEG